MLTKKDFWIAQVDQGRSIQVAYSNFGQYANLKMPSKVQILASQSKGNTEIKLNYNTITVNESLTFPYSVPEGYTRITIK